MNKNYSNNKGFSPIVLLVVIVIAVGVVGTVLFMSTSNNSAPESALGDLPPAEERTNPDPVGDNFVSVGDVNPGSSVIVREASLSSNGYIVVYRDNDTATARAEVGRSELLNAGIQSNISISTQALSDGQVIYVAIVNSNGAAVTDELGGAIEVQKNVGMMAGHQMDHLDESQSYY